MSPALHAALHAAGWGCTGWGCTSELLTIVAPVTLSIVAPTVAVAGSACTLTCAVFDVASSSARLSSMRSATWLESTGDRRMATKSLIS